MVDYIPTLNVSLNQSNIFQVADPKFLTHMTRTWMRARVMQCPLLLDISQPWTCVIGWLKTRASTSPTASLGVGFFFIFFICHCKSASVDTTTVIVDASPYIPVPGLSHCPYSAVRAPCCGWHLLQAWFLYTIFSIYHRYASGTLSLNYPGHKRRQLGFSIVTGHQSLRVSYCTYT
jgi:hypothetical protein